MAEPENESLAERLDKAYCRGWDDAEKAIRDSTADLLERSGKERAELETRIEELEGYLHRIELHPEYEYETTRGPRKIWLSDSNIPPEGEGWARNPHKGEEGEGGWERFDYYEEAYWMRLKGDIGG